MSKISAHFKGDKVIWVIVAILSVFSILAVYSSTSTLAYRFHQGNTEYYLLKHGLLLVLGILVMFIVHKIPYKKVGNVSLILLMLVIPLLVTTLFWGIAMHGGATRYQIIPIINLTFQPSDIAKLVLIIYLAFTLVEYQQQEFDMKNTLLRIFLPILLVVAFVLPADLSTAAIIFGASMVVLIVGRLNWKYLAGIIGASALGVGLLILVLMANPGESRFPTWEKRMKTYLGFDETANYQLEQSKIAMANANIFGRGPGNSTQKNVLPQSFSDFIFAIIVEEYGLIAGSIVVLLYLVLLFRGIRIATKTNDIFGAILAFGLTFSIVAQALINIGVTVGLLPVTGQPLPMISMGGTSLWFTSIAIGIVLSISRYIEDPPKTEEVYA